MAGEKEVYEIGLQPDQMAFIRSAKEKYNIIDESKTFRAVVDYLISNPNVHDDVFGKRRCLRCE